LRVYVLQTAVYVLRSIPVEHDDCYQRMRIHRIGQF
jgi:hypothetical protein